MMAASQAESSTGCFRCGLRCSACQIARDLVGVNTDRSVMNMMVVGASCLQFAQTESRFCRVRKKASGDAQRGLVTQDPALTSSMAVWGPTVGRVVVSAAVQGFHKRTRPDSSNPDRVLQASLDSTDKADEAGAGDARPRVRRCQGTVAKNVAVQQSS
jgi:hypothetical protein